MQKRKKATKIALVASLLLIALWIMLGTNASLAWFKDEDTIVNSLNFGDLDVDLFHKVADEYLPVDSTTEVFSDAALYEPGYTQIVYLRIDNAGTMDFTYDLSVIPDLTGIVIGKNEMGGDIYLPDYLYFGFAVDDTEAGLLAKTADRDFARTYAVHKLNNYSEDGGTLAVGESDYAALVLYMPEEVDNAANYRGDTVPSVEVGIGVIANQIRD